MKSTLADFLPKRSEMQLSPVLTESPFSRYVVFSVLYFAQGVPEGLVFFAIPAWLAMNEVSPVIIGSYVAVATLPWTFKIVLAPLMDRFTIKPMGRKRPWVIFGQIGLVLSFVFLSTLKNPISHMSTLMDIGFVISFFGCFQDVATDSMAVDIIPLDEQARANGLMWGSKVIGTSASLAVGTYMINQFGFSIGVLVPAAFTSMLVLAPVYFLERKGERRFPWSKGSASSEAELLQTENFLQLLKYTFLAVTRYSSLIFIVAAMLLGFALSYVPTLLPIFTINELGWTNDDYSNLYATANIVSGLLGMFVGGALVDFFGKKRMLLFFILFWMLSIAGFLFYRASWFDDSVATFVFYASSVGAVFTTIAAFSVCMAHCWKRVSATQFTLYMALSNLGRSIGAVAAGTTKDLFDWDLTFAVVLVVLAIMALLVGMLQIRRQLKSIQKLEEKVLAKTLPKFKPSLSPEQQHFKKGDGCH
jgi:PAT family beta-lactamase induction signal transducer AmpG